MLQFWGLGILSGGLRPPRGEGTDTLQLLLSALWKQSSCTQAVADTG